MEENPTKKPELLNAAEAHKDTQINPIDLTNEMIMQPGLYLKYALKHQKAMRTEGNAKLALEVTQSATDKRIRDDAAEKGEKLTEAKISSQVSTDKRVIAAIKAYNDAKSDTALTKDILEALKQKRDMIVQLGVNAREEMKGEVRVMDTRSEIEARKARIKAK